jgi:hypothetical protein
VSLPFAGKVFATRAWKCRRSPGPIAVPPAVVPGPFLPPEEQRQRCIGPGGSGGAALSGSSWSSPALRPVVRRPHRPDPRSRSPCNLRARSGTGSHRPARRRRRRRQATPAAWRGSVCRACRRSRPGPPLRCQPAHRTAGTGPSICTCRAAGTPPMQPTAAGTGDDRRPRATGLRVPWIWPPPRRTRLPGSATAVDPVLESFGGRSREEAVHRWRPGRQHAGCVHARLRRATSGRSAALLDPSQDGVGRRRAALHAPGPGDLAGSSPHPTPRVGQWASPRVVTMVSHGPGGTSARSTNCHETVPRPSRPSWSWTAGETSMPAESLAWLAGAARPNT